MVLSSPPTSLTSLAQGVAMPPCMASLLLSLQSNQGDVGDHQGMGATTATTAMGEIALRKVPELTNSCS